MTSGHTITTEPAPGRVQIVIGGETLADSHRAPCCCTRPGSRPATTSRATTSAWIVSSRPTCRPRARSRATRSTGRSASATVSSPRVAWSYPEPIEGREDIAGLVCFFNERVDELTVDGVSIMQST